MSSSANANSRSSTPLQPLPDLPTLNLISSSAIPRSSAWYCILVGGDSRFSNPFQVLCVVFYPRRRRFQILHPIPDSLRRILPSSALIPDPLRRFISSLAANTP
ncbi:hypothetical protein LZ554_000901 [Drepanopeziza brunnea f. sp. 'monogermtubi']|nr:hypothetical protein LZ554_000901 [Drepanopeziza brunnea f. sp. 'monogermtubi']